MQSSGERVYIVDTVFNRPSFAVDNILLDEMEINISTHTLLHTERKTGYKIN